VHFEVTFTMKPGKQ